jgi:hypothetical protein
MEPALGAGDLVAVRAGGPYAVGDVLAYRSPALDRILLHRVVALDDGRFVLKGDANTWLDGYRPRTEEIVGELWWRIPGAGARLRGLRSPLGASAGAMLAAVGVVGGRRFRRRGSHVENPNGARRGERERPRSRAERASGRHRGGGPTMTILGGLAVLSALAAATLAALPDTARIVHERPYEHRGTFGYRAAIPADAAAAYGAESAETGDPVYLRLSDRVALTFGYALVADGEGTTTGTAGLVAELADANGWSRSIALAPTTPFTGSKVSVGGELDLRELARMTADLERITGVARDHYTVIVTARVVVDGTLEGRPLAETFAPALRFLLDADQLQLEPPGSAPPGEEGPADPIHPVAGGLVRTTQTRPRDFAIAGARIGLDDARIGAFAALGAALLGLLGAAAIRLRAARRGEPALIAARYGRWLVPAAATPSAAGGSVELESFDSLVRIADHYGHVVMHERSGAQHTYSVDQGGVSYRYRTVDGIRR